MQQIATDKKNKKSSMNLLPISKIKGITDNLYFRITIVPLIL